MAEHPRSLFIFDEQNPFRQFCRRMARSAWFDCVIFTVIIANTVTMASLNMRDPEAQNADGMAETEFASTILYAVEALVKIVDQGFWFAPDTYMDSGWNQFDFLLVCGTLVSLFESRLGNQFLALRAFRCFRPLRAMKNFRDGQLLMRTTLAAIPLLRDALIFLCWFMLVASITGTMIFGGKLNARCVEPAGLAVNSCPVKSLVNVTYLVSDETMTRHVCDPNGKGFKCDGGVGEVCCDSDKYPQDGFLSFDNFWRSAIIVLQTITVDGWNESAKVAADASGIVRVGPYFAILVFFGGFYVLQLFTSVMIITLSHCSDKLEEQEAEAEERERLGLPPLRGTAFDLQEDKVGEFVNWMGKATGRGFVAAKRKIGIKEKDPSAETTASAARTVPRVLQEAPEDVRARLVRSYGADRHRPEHGVDGCQLVRAERRILRGSERLRTRLHDRVHRGVCDQASRVRTGVVLVEQVELHRRHHRHLGHPGAVHG